MTRFNVPRLFFFPLADGSVHIGRSNISGTETECGIVLERGQVYVREEPTQRLCAACVKAIESLPFERGIRA
jgi:hypothetical protein